MKDTEESPTDAPIAGERTDAPITRDALLKRIVELAVALGEQRAMVAQLSKIVAALQAPKEAPQ